MNREKYLAELEEYLQPLTPEERADAIMFYSECRFREQKSDRATFGHPQAVESQSFS